MLFVRHLILQYTDGLASDLFDGVIIVIISDDGRFGKEMQKNHLNYSRIDIAFMVIKQIDGLQDRYLYLV